MESPRDAVEEGDGRQNPPTPNPFTLPPIMRALVRHLAFKDLANCRLLSHDWRTSCQRKFKRKAKVTFRALAELRSFCDDNAHVDSNFPFKSYEFVGLGMRSLLFADFVRRFGGCVECLSMSGCDWRESGTTFRDALEWRLPNLRELDLRLTNHFPVSAVVNRRNLIAQSLRPVRRLTVDMPVFDEWLCPIPDLELFLHHLLIALPNLQVLKHPPHPHPTHNYDSYFCRILFQLLIHSPQVSLRHLRHCQLSLELSTADMELLKRKATAPLPQRNSLCQK